MSFKVWFWSWIRLFFRILRFDYFGERGRRRQNRKWVPHKREKTRKSQRENRLKSKLSNAQRLFKRSSKLILDITAFVFGLFFLPIGLVDWGVRSARIRSKNAGGRRKSAGLESRGFRITSDAKGKGVDNGNSRGSDGSQRGDATSAYEGEKTQRQDPCQLKCVEYAGSSSRIALSEEKGDTPEYTSCGQVRVFDDAVREAVPQSQHCIDSFSETSAADNFEGKEEKVTSGFLKSANIEPEKMQYSEDTPKSVPKDERDRYIRKRMMVERQGSCDGEGLSELRVGSYLNLMADEGEESEKDAVLLLYRGIRVGEVEKGDRVALSTCLRLNRRMYAVITDLIISDGITKYEFEVWFEY